MKARSPPSARRTIRIDHDDPIEEVFEDQLACADLVVLSKSDLVSSEALAGIEDRLAAVLRPGVRIVRSHGALLPAVLIGLHSAAEDDMAARAGHHGEEEEHDHDDFDSIVVTPSPATSVDAMRVRISDAQIPPPGCCASRASAAAS